MWDVCASSAVFVVDSHSERRIVKMVHASVVVVLIFVEVRESNQMKPLLIEC